MALREVDPVANAIAATDVEVANSAWEDREGYYEPDNNGDHSLEKMDSIGGTGPIEAHEVWDDARGVGVHREEDDDEIDERLAERDGQLRAAQQEIEELKERADPHRREREAQERERLTYEVLQNPGQVVDGVRGLQQQVQGLHVEASMSKAKIEHGGDFDEAFQTLTSLDPRNPVHRAHVQRIYHSPNPGQAVMEWYSRLGGGGGGGSRPRLPASLNTNSPGRSRPMPARGGWSSMDDEGAFRAAAPGNDRDVADSAWS
jgi:hypothetical protein